MAVGGRAEPVLRAEAAAKLAELRLAQGRLDDAEHLLAGFEDQPATVYARAALHLARGEPKVAISLVRRRLRDLGEEYRERAGLLDLLVAALAAAGDRHELAARIEEVARRPEGRRHARRRLLRAGARSRHGVARRAVGRRAS